MSVSHQLSPAAARRKPPIPVSVLTGFLGAGKTTLLNRLLASPEFANTAVIINEFGDVGLDHLFVAEVSDGIIELSSGCLCCTIRGELITTLENLLRAVDNGRIDRLERVVIETTGVADPGPVLHTIMLHPYLVQRYRLDGVVTVVDAVNGAATLDRQPEAPRQVAVADRLVISKTDLVDNELPPALCDRLKALNPAAPILLTADPKVDLRQLIDTGLYTPRAAEPDVAAWLGEARLAATPSHHHGGTDDPHGDAPHHHHDHDHHHQGHQDEHKEGHHEGHGHDHGHDHHHETNRHGSIEAFSFASDQAIASHDLETFLELLGSAHGEKLLRVKGIAKLRDDPERPLVVHGVQHVFHPPVQLTAWPAGDTKSTRFVFITDGLSRAYVERIFRALTGEIGVDQPDKAALADNPLAPPGLHGH